MRKLESLNLSKKVTSKLLTAFEAELVGMDIANGPSCTVDEYGRIDRDLTGLFRFGVITAEDLDELRDYAYEYMHDRLERWLNQ